MSKITRPFFEVCIYVFIGEILHEISQKTYAEFAQKKFAINIRDTSLYVPFDYRIDHYETVSQILVYDTARNQLILNDVAKEAPRRNTILILSERKAHVHVLHLYLKEKFETIAITGDDSQTQRKTKLKQIYTGHYKIVIKAFYKIYLIPRYFLYICA